MRREQIRGTAAIIIAVFGILLFILGYAGISGCVLEGDMEYVWDIWYFIFIPGIILITASPLVAWWQPAATAHFFKNWGHQIAAELRDIFSPESRPSFHRHSGRKVRHHRSSGLNRRPTNRMA